MIALAIPPICGLVALALGAACFFAGNVHDAAKEALTMISFALKCSPASFCCLDLRAVPRSQPATPRWMTASVDRMGRPQDRQPTCNAGRSLTRRERTNRPLATNMDASDEPLSLFPHVS
jgi:hypothetical protein